MILRGTVLSEKRTPLDSAHPDRAIPVSRFPVSVPGSDPVAATVVELVPPVTRSPLSLDAVLEWLEHQDQATHTALATHLASDLEEVKLIAEREGFASGTARGLKDAQAKTQTTIELLAQVATEAQLTLTQESEQLAAQCVDIVLEVLGKIAGPALCGRDAIVPVVLQAVGRLKDEREMIIRVSERDLPALSEAQATLSQALSGRKFVVLADSRIELGGCIVESRLGSLDARLETQLRAAFEALNAARTASGAEALTP
jgi:flagellar biosynthesis/type III secretory pathway protein FliH